MAAFPKLLGTDSKQHTYVETETVRYVYQPLENLYLLLVTNRASNIVEDLETLRLLSKVVPDICGTTNHLTEDKISDKCFELIFAFDEVLTSGGYREPITLQQIRTNLEMESHEEKLHNMIKISKMESAKDQARDAARTIKERQKEQQMRGGSAMEGMGSHGGSFHEEQAPRSGAYVETAVAVAPKTVSNSVKAPVVKGMSLMSKGGKNKALEEALYKEDKLAPALVSSKSAAISNDMATPVISNPVVQHPIMLVVAEKICAKMSRDGVVDQLEVKGSLTLTASTDEYALCSVQLKMGSVDAFSFNTHPKINKALYDKSGLLQLKDITKGFPSARPVGILRWTHNSNNDELVPIKINCWPEEEARGQMNVSIEYTMEQKNIVLHDVHIHIPLGTAEPPNIVSMDGTFKHNASTNEMIWILESIDQSNSTGSLEFNISQKNSDAFFPINVQFVSQEIFCDLEVLSVKTSDGTKPIQYGITTNMSSEEYIIE